MKTKKRWAALARNHDFAKGEDLNQKLQSFPKMSKVGNVMSKLV